MELGDAIRKIFSELRIEPTEPEDLDNIKFRSSGLSLEIAEQHGRMVTIALAKGNRRMAYEAIERAFRVAECESAPVSEESSLYTVLSERLANKLAKSGVITIGDVLKVTPLGLAKISKINIRTALFVENVVKEHGFGLCD